MRLSRKIILNSAILIGGLVLVGTASLVGLERLRHDVVRSKEEYEELRRIGRIEVAAIRAQNLLSTFRPDTRAISDTLTEAISELQVFVDATDQHNAGSRTGNAEDAHARRAMEKLNSVLQQVEIDPFPVPLIWRPEAQSDIIESALNDVRALAHDTDAEVIATYDAANEHVMRMRVLIAGLLFLLIASAVIVSFWQFRSIMAPVLRLREGVQRLGTGKFDEAVEAPGDDELAELADEFNRMAKELEQFYRRLEQMVADKSRELVRSERLASVGFLAAGVAHEINNPLAIIAGYAQERLQEIQERGNREEDQPTIKALQIICDESFRCTAIVRKLLSLSRPGGDEKSIVSVPAVMREMADLVRALPRYRGRKLVLDVPADADLTITGNANELKQVLLNLTVNALEAVEPEVGQVRLEAAAENGVVRVCVRDNGRGMDTKTLQHVFEPFFTTKRGTEGRGTGLGLSICHAIVEAHGGRIRAESDGPGSGSSFILDLPRAEVLNAAS